ncbi:DNA mismatch repair endonuclease MutL [Clostridium tarantellae]|uniref:DNA mismatch repair protein MutL n=1 Tax=Clostridium tarantellae TaxID=39493 RepID=A0A6I1MLQ0_9CLOT|nr:DNA mismatch repair endonuclease MutL [Clostridium tarantellae]MPQ43940.1 DNA mismatch repair endonuclease MutL [Clostridium tarantellae]
MNRINVLTMETANKIAAGEVVERPSSVVKELIENSLDAKCKNITIEIREGGESLIKIIDDGIGIHPDDIKKAFSAHATSKIKNVDDIFSINTLGFRGEALPSIASISKVFLKSKIFNEPIGKEIRLLGGIEESFKDSAISKGTQIEVMELFFNVPARKKFLKSVSREGAIINDIVSRIALANPEVSFQLFNNSKKTVHTYGNGKLIDAIRSIYGKSTAENLIYFEKHEDTVSIYGYIGNDSLSRGSRNNQSLFVNKRYVKNRTITVAVENAYKSFNTSNKFPFYVLFIEVYPELIDVNIHPTKSDIKFKDERVVFKCVFDAIHEALREEVKDNFNINPLNEEEKKIVYKELEEVTQFSLNEEINKLDGLKESIASNKNFFNDFQQLNKEEKESIFSNKEVLGKNEREEIEIPLDLSYRQPNTNDYKREENEDKTNKEEIAKFPKLKVIGQFNKTYILAEKEEILYLIDQHAAHEKILFEKYLNTIENSKVEIQPLIVPLVLDLSLNDFIFYEENKDIFEKAGFIIEDFGNNSIRISEVPYFLGKLNAKSLFLSILDNVKNLGTGKTREVKYNKIATLACKAAVKANDTLSILEMESLIEELRYIEDPFHCPHGRPTIIKFTSYELDKKFKRIL